jgi:predicted acylesterase/phospholipase RssA
MAPIATANAHVTIAVSLSGSEAGGRYEPTDTEPRATTEWLNRMWRSTTALFDSTASRSGDSDAELVDAGKEADVPKLGSFEVMNRTIDIAQAALARHTLAAYPPICSSRCHERRAEASNFIGPQTRSMSATISPPLRSTCTSPVSRSRRANPARM